MKVAGGQYCRPVPVAHLLKWQFPTLRMGTRAMPKTRAIVGDATPTSTTAVNGAGMHPAPAPDTAHSAPTQPEAPALYSNPEPSCS